MFKGKLMTFDRRSRMLVALIIGASMLFGWGITQAITATGPGGAGGHVVQATVADCQKRTECSVTYTFEGRQHTADFDQAQHTYSAGTVLQLTVFSSKPEKIYPLHPYPMWVACTWIALSLALLTLWSLKLYRHWKHQAAAESGHALPSGDGDSGSGVDDGVPDATKAQGAPAHKSHKSNKAAHKSNKAAQKSKRKRSR